MLLICPVREGERNEQLRYALRSWEANLPYDRLELLIVGHRPTWLNVSLYIPGNLHASPPLNVWYNIHKVSQFLDDSGRGYEPALYMNDDFFAMRPVAEVHPVKRNITLAEHIAMFPSPEVGWWPRSLQMTLDFLRERGHQNPFSWEVHRPLLARPAAMRRAMEQWDGGLTNGVPQWRTMHGVLNNVEAEPVSDAKLGYRGADRSSDWVSTPGHSWLAQQALIGQRFQKPSRWELD